ncbi:MAG: sulfurtransferase TusA family protein [Caldivirga sp.]|jgi:tRNA 2-thiouridine synthesizing protein A|uniref:sulfurtransferase TusA family protein n=1 Tax=Caldivirga sp. TaxID=2080243 RepID=UPI003D0A3BF8
MSMVLNSRLTKVDDKYVVDLRGLICPYPQLYTAKVIKSVENDAIIDVLVDYPASCQTIPLVAGKLNCSVLDIIQVNKYWVIRLRKNPEPT